MTFVHGCPLTLPSQADLDFFVRQGVLVPTLARPEPVRIAHGVMASDGRLEPDADGDRWFAVEVPEADDIVFWHPPAGNIASWSGRAFALGESRILEPATYSIDGRLNILADPLAWLRAQRDGIVILPGKWPLAFDRLREAPRIAIAEQLLPDYRKFMKPARMPELFVVRSTARTAA